MSDLQSKAADSANNIMGRYATLIKGMDPEDLRVLLQYAFLEGRMDGLEAAHAAHLEAVEKVLGGSK